MKVKVIFETIKKFTVKNLPTIMTIAGVAGFTASIGLAIKETPKANKALEELKKEKEDPKVIDKAKVLIPVYWPMGIAAIASGASIIFANHINLKRLSTMLALYKLSEDNKDKIDEAMRKILGDSKTEEVYDRLDKDVVDNTPFNADTIVNTGNGNQRFMDGLSRQRFVSSAEAVRSGFTILNRRIRDEDSQCVNDLMDILGIYPLDPAYVGGNYIGGSGLDLGERLGWKYDQTNMWIQPKITWCNDFDGEPIGVITYPVSFTEYLD